jgi:VWFA-related protein
MIIHRLLLLPAACCLLLIVFCASTSRAQDEPPPPAPPPPPQQPVARQEAQEGVETVRVDTELVDLNVSVFARNRQLQIGELKQKDFKVFENGIEQEISFFASAAAPFDLVLLLDLSGSTVDKLNLLKKSAQRFVEAARPTDRVSIVTFTNEARIVSPLTFDREELKARIRKIKKPEGGTKFWDALLFVLGRVFDKNAAAERRSAVVVMTDGIDNALPDVPGDGSVINYRQLLSTVRESEAIVLPIYLDTEEEMVRERRWVDVPSTYAIARRQLALLAEESGSTLYSARRIEDLKGVYEQVIRDLGTIYSIGYNPTNKQRDGSWRAIKVQFVNHPELAARTRRGYIAK